MNLETTLDAIKKHGITAIIVLLYLRNEARLNVVEDKLYNCYAMNIMSHRKTAEVKPHTYAILPNEISVK